VRWGFAQLKRHKNRPDHSFQVFDHLAVPKPDDAIATLGKFGRTRVIGRLLLSMLTTIQLDCQFLCWTGKDHDAASNRMLPAEFPRRLCRP
jgi:hypothetical protein